MNTRQGGEGGCNTTSLCPFEQAKWRQVLPLMSTALMKDSSPNKRSYVCVCVRERRCMFT